MGKSERMLPRLAVVVFPPAEAVTDAEAFRREHDPLFHRIAAHLTVVFPLEGLDPASAARRLERALEEAKGRIFAVGLGGAGRYDDGVVFLRVGRGAEELCRLHDALTAAVGPPGTTRLPYLPHLTVGRAAGEAEAIFLERQAAGRITGVRFSVEALSVVVEDARGLWLEKVRIPLPPDEDGPRATIGPIPLRE